MSDKGHDSGLPAGPPGGSGARERSMDPELERQVGLLWLGEEYAQLDPSFCHWRRSGPESACRPEDLNRSAFVAWIDCRL